MSWTDERIALLKKMWGEGKTAAEIAKELGEVTRNAVIGKAHRLKLSNRVSPIQQNKKPVPVKQPAAAAPEKKIHKIQDHEHRRTGLKLNDLNSRMCHWPLGDPQDADFCFCGDGAVVGLPYCPDHARAAYQVASRARTLNAADFEDRGRDKDADDGEVKVSA